MKKAAPHALAPRATVFCRAGSTFWRRFARERDARCEQLLGQQSHVAAALLLLMRFASASVANVLVVEKCLYSKMTLTTIALHLILLIIDMSCCAFEASVIIAARR